MSVPITLLVVVKNPDARRRASLLAGAPMPAEVPHDIALERAQDPTLYDRLAAVAQLDAAGRPQPVGRTGSGLALYSTPHGFSVADRLAVLAPEDLAQPVPDGLALARAAIAALDARAEAYAKARADEEAARVQRAKDEEAARVQRAKDEEAAREATEEARLKRARALFVALKDAKVQDDRLSMASPDRPLGLMSEDDAIETLRDIVLPERVGCALDAESPDVRLTCDEADEINCPSEYCRRRDEGSVAQEKPIETCTAAEFQTVQALRAALGRHNNRAVRVSFSCSCRKSRWTDSRRVGVLASAEVAPGITVERLYIKQD